MRDLTGELPTIRDLYLEAADFKTQSSANDASKATSANTMAALELLVVMDDGFGHTDGTDDWPFDSSKHTP